MEFKLNLHFYLAIFLAAVAPVITTSSSGIEKRAAANFGLLIVGGKPAYKGQFPFQVSMQVGTRHICGGSIMNEDTIITAAHCCVGFSPKSLSVVAGDLYLRSDDKSEQRLKVKEVRSHQNYTKQTMENDICILKLEAPIKFTQNLVGPVVLPNKSLEEPVANRFMVSGWGSTVPRLSSKDIHYTPMRYSSTTSDILRWVQVPLVSDEVCKKQYESNRIQPTESMICAGVVGRDSCQGDSGGPLVESDTNKLVGVVSWGDGCAQASKAGVYTQVSYFLDWLEEYSK